MLSRRAIANSAARRVFAHQQPHACIRNQRFWGHERIPSSPKIGARSYHSGYGSTGQSWDGLVYSIMANIRGQMDFGPECFYSAISDPDTDSKDDSRRDMRQLVTLHLNRASLLALSQDIQLRLEMLCKSEAHTSDYATVLSLVKMLEKLGKMSDDNPKLELEQYREIWMTLRDGVAASNDMPVQIISINEVEELKHIKWNAECVWSIAVLNAALLHLYGTAIPQEMGQDEAEKKTTFNGDLRSMSYKINGLLLDSKDFFPEGKRWFSREQEKAILQAIIRVGKEAEKRRHM